jgi:hypothetical protein
MDLQINDGNISWEKPASNQPWHVTDTARLTELSRCANTERYMSIYSDVQGANPSWARSATSKVDIGLQSETELRSFYNAKDMR